MSTSSEIIPFAFDELLIRTIMIDDEPWFVAADISRALCFRDNANAVRALKPEEKGTRQISTPGGMQSQIIISEAGLYRLIFRSDKAEARRFQDFVFQEVLPALRRTGRYAMADAPAQPAAPSTEAETLRSRIELVREARQSFGRAVARQLWLASGLPVVDGMIERPAIEDEPTIHISQLLALTIAGQPLATHWQEGNSRQLAAAGMRALGGRLPGLWIDTAAPACLAAFGHGWHRRTAGAIPMHARINGRTRRGILLPAMALASATIGEAA